MGSSYVTGAKTFLAGEFPLEPNRLVKLKTGTTTDPDEIVYAGAGEDSIGVTFERAYALGQPLGVRLHNANGTVLITCAIDSAIAIGTLLYSANDGKVSDASSGSVLGVALRPATEDGEDIEVLISNRKPTTAAGTSLTDAGGIIPGVELETATEDVYKHIRSVQQFISVPLQNVLESDGTNATALTGSTTPIFDMADGDTDSGLVLTWVASNSDAIIFQVPLPPNLDDTGDVVVHFRAKSGGATDTPIFSADSYFNEGDTKIEDDSAAVSATFAELMVTIAAADVTAGSQTLTCKLTPGAHTTNALVLSAIWVEYKGALLLT